MRGLCHGAKHGQDTFLCVWNQEEESAPGVVRMYTEGVGA